MQHKTLSLICAWLLSLNACAVAQEQQEQNHEQEAPAATTEELPPIAYTLLKGANSEEAAFDVGYMSEDFYLKMYLSYFHAKDKLSYAGQKFAAQPYTSWRIGFKAGGGEIDKRWVLDAGYYYYRNSSSFNIDRFGFGVNLGTRYKLTPHHSLGVGVDFMPEWLSTNWGADALLEYSSKAYWQYNPNPFLSLQLEYRRGDVLDNIRINFYRQALAGLTVRF